ncbi:MAG: hypothetical protein CMJ48_11780 [Planctomycetaceae bacterium]|nr:hypothetical protein [Planctomycetaceae bacterium]
MRIRKKHSRDVLDVKFTGSGVKRWVIKYRCRSYFCRECSAVLFPEEFKEIAKIKRAKYGTNLSRWVAYKSVALRQTNEHIVDELFDVLGFSFRPGLVSRLKRQVARFHETTYIRLLDGLRDGHLIHADETWVLVRGQPGKCYVWAFADMQRVIYVYSRTRETKVAEQALEGFKGVLVSDFYAAYDSLKCPQQKCLIHLMRDVNNDMRKHPFDEELRTFVQEFGKLLRIIVATIDAYGLKRRHLRKHREDVQRFYGSILEREFGSEIAEHYRQRMIRYRDKLFTFLEHDGVPWNNNNAENAIKLFVARRRIIGTSFSEAGIQEFLTLLSIYQTLRYRKRSFLEFLLSGATDVDEFCR